MESDGRREDDFRVSIEIIIVRKLFTAKLERWIGGIYDWHGMAWKWGVSGEKIVFENFEKLQYDDPKQYAWHCVVMDPRIDYKWKPVSCVKRKHYICEVPVGRIGNKIIKDSNPNENDCLSINVQLPTT